MTPEQQIERLRAALLAIERATQQEADWGPVAYQKCVLKCRDIAQRALRQKA